MSAELAKDEELASEDITTPDPGSSIDEAISQFGKDLQDAVNSGYTNYGQTEDEYKTPDVQSTFTKEELCGGDVILDKRFRVIRTHEHTLWLFFVDSLVSTGAILSNIFTISDIDGKNSFNTSQVNEEESVLFVAFTDSESLIMPSSGSITKNVLWTIYFDNDSKTYKPIKGVKYFDIWYDDVLQTLDLFFWANVSSDAANSSGGVSYPGDLVKSINSDGSVNTSAQRAMFYSKAIYKSILHTRKGAGLKSNMSFWFFSKPIMIFNPGTLSKTSQGDVVVDVLPNTTKFISFNT